MSAVTRTGGEEPSGSGAMGIVIGALIVLVLLVGGWWLFMRQSVPVTPDTTIIEQPAPDTTIIEQPAPDPNVEGDTNVIVPDNGGTEQTSTP